MPKLLNIEFSAITSVNSVSATTIQNVDNVTYNDDGTNLLIGGRFKGYDEYDGSIVKVLANGSKDTTFDSGIGFIGFESLDIGFTSPLVNCIEIDSNGDYYVGGVFSVYNTVSANNIVKLLKTGEIDTSFDYSTGFNNTVRVICIQSDGKILVGGGFTTYKGLTANGIIRLNPNGSIDSSFNSGIQTLNGPVWSIVCDSNDNIYVGGGFDSYSGFSAQRIVKLTPNGSVDQSFNLNSGFDNVVNKITVDSSDNLYVGGFFISYSGQSANRIIKLLNNGKKDITFDNTTGFNGRVNDIKIDVSGKLYVVGSFTTYKGATNTRIIKLNTDGTKDATFSSVNTFTTNNATEMNTIHIDSAGGIYIGGRFTSYSLFFQNSLIKVNSAGALDLSFNSFGAIGPNQSVYVIKTDSNGDLIVGGLFNAYKQPSNLASISAYDARKNTAFNPNYGTNLSVSTTGIQVASLAKSPSNNIYAGGFFENYTLLNSNYRAIAILGLNLDGSPNPSIDVNSGANSTIQNIFIDSVGGIYLMGSFTAYKGVSVPRFVKINANASIDNTFNRSGLFNGSVYSTIDFDSNDDLYLGGSFTTFSGQTNNRIIKLLKTGFKDNTFDNSIGFNNTVSTIKVDQYGKILVGGSFGEYKGVSENGIIRLNPDGSKDISFDNSIGFNSTVSKINTWGDKIYVYGSFTSYKGQPYNNIIRLNYDGSVDKSFRLKSGLSPFQSISNSLVDGNGNLYLIGQSIIYQKYTVSRVVKIKPDGSRDVLFNVNSENFKNLTAGSIPFLLSGILL